MSAGRHFSPEPTEEVDHADRLSGMFHLFSMASVKIQNKRAIVPYFGLKAKLISEYFYNSHIKSVGKISTMKFESGSLTMLFPGVPEGAPPQSRVRTYWQVP